MRARPERLVIADDQCLFKRPVVIQPEGMLIDAALGNRWQQMRHVNSPPVTAVPHNSYPPPPPTQPPKPSLAALPRASRGAQRTAGPGRRGWLEIGLIERTTLILLLSHEISCAWLCRALMCPSCALSLAVSARRRRRLRNDFLFSLLFLFRHRPLSLTG